MNDLDKAREWAGRVYAQEPDTQATCRVIQSLPDEWIDANKLLDEADRMEEGARNAEKRGAVEWSHGYAEAMRECAKHLRALLPTPKPRTLADMPPEEREACKWMQADVKLANGGSVTCVIANPRMPGAKVRVWAPHGGSDDVEEGRVTPLPDLPKLEWPGGGVRERRRF